MSAGGGGIVEKLEHSILVDGLSIGVYVFFAYVAYNNLGFGDSVMQFPPPSLNVAAVQLAIVLVVINIIFIVHDKVGGGGGPLS